MGPISVPTLLMILCAFPKAYAVMTEGRPIAALLCHHFLISSITTSCGFQLYFESPNVHSVIK